jgi:cell division protein FtsW (lipid II flippase)
VKRPSTPLGQIDVPLVLALIALCVFSLIMVYSASWDFSQAAYGSSTRIFYRQVAWMALGIALIFGLAYVNYHPPRWVSY